MFPIIKVYGDGMIITSKYSNIKQGDIIAFYYNNKILIKRVIATNRQNIDIDNYGNVYIDGNLLDEKYISL